MYIKQAWNLTKISKVSEVSIFAKKRQMLLGTKQIHYKLPKIIWNDEKEFLKQAVSMPFRSDVRKPVKMIVIGGARIGKTTLVSNILNDLQNDFGVQTLSIYPKGIDAVYHNKLGKGKILCPGDSNKVLRNKLYMPHYKEEDIPKEMQTDLDKFSFELYDFNVNTEPGFMEDDPKEFSKSVYVYLSILYEKFPYLIKKSAKEVLKAIETLTYQSTRFSSDDKIYMPFASYESLKARLMGASSKKFFYESKNKINETTFLRDWYYNKSHSFIFSSDPNDPRVQSYTAKILQIAQKSKRRHNIQMRKLGKKEKPLWLIIDDAREIVAKWMDFERFRARREVERCIYMFGEDGWNVILVYHNVDDIPQGLLKEADFIICSRLDKDDVKNLPGETFRSAIQRLYVKEYNYYNEWAIRSKDGMVRTFYAIDSPVGLK